MAAEVLLLLLALAGCQPDRASQERSTADSKPSQVDREQQAALDLKADWDAHRDSIRSAIETYNRAQNPNEAMKLVVKYGAIAGNGLEPMATEARRLKREADLLQEIANRKEYARLIRDRFLDGGLDIKVSVEGRQAEILKMRYVLFSDVWSHRFEKNGQVETARTMGFRRMEMTDGRYWKVYWKLDS